MYLAMQIFQEFIYFNSDDNYNKLKQRNYHVICGLLDQDQLKQLIINITAIWYNVGVEEITILQKAMPSAVSFFLSTCTLLSSVNR